jgi:hypothetical protein
MKNQRNSRRQISITSFIIYENDQKYMIKLSSYNKPYLSKFRDKFKFNNNREKAKYIT